MLLALCRLPLSLPCDLLKEVPCIALHTILKQQGDQTGDIPDTGSPTILFKSKQD